MGSKKGERNIERKSWGLFKEAATDYFFLRNRGYREKTAVKLVGDRYQLSGNERMMLYRGITTIEKAKIRKNLITSDMESWKGKTFYMDGYNVCYTIMNYLAGKQVFIGNDGFLRDTGNSTENRGKNESLFHCALKILGDFLEPLEFGNIVVYLDASAGNNGVERDVVSFKEEMERKLKRFEIYPVISADNELKKTIGGIIASSDSEILDATTCPVIDAARLSLEKQYRLQVVEMETIFGSV